MAAEIDPVILELRAEMNRYRADLQATTALVDQQFGRQQRSVQQLERQFQQSSGAIGGSLRSLAGAFAAALSVREIVNMGDAWSDMSSQVGVAIRDMERAPEIMQRLTTVARASYSPLEQTATQFARNARTLDQMGYNTDAALRYTEALNNALVATATRGDRARQVQDSLSKAIATGKLEAEGLENILAHGGAVAESVAKSLGVTTNELYRLRKEGKITGDVLVRSLIDNFDELRAQAETMPATVSDGFVLLRNALLQYLGETDKSLAATERMAQAMITLSENIDVVAKALALIAVFYGARYVASAARATAANVALSGSLVGTAGAMGATGAASFALQARLAGAATSMQALAFAARGAGAALLSMFGGPVGVAILAVAAGLYLVHQRTSELDRAIGRYKRGLEVANRITDRARELSEKLATARGKERQATLEALRIEKARAQQALVSAENDLIAANAALARARAVRQEQSQRQGFGRGIGGMGMDPGGISTSIAGIPERQAEANMRAAWEAAGEIKKGIDDIQAIIDGATAGPPIPTGEDGKTKKPPKPSGPSEDQLARQDAQSAAEMSRLRQEELRARMDLATSAEERADLATELLREERDDRVAALNAELGARAKEISDAETLSAAQKKARLEAIEAERRASLEYIDRLYGPQATDGEIPVRPPSLYQQQINLDERRQLEQEAQDLAEEHYRAEDERLRLAYDLARTEADRRTIALRILEAEDDYLRAKLEAIEASEVVGEAERERARIALEALNANASGRRAAVERDHQGAFGRYLDSTADPRSMAEDAAVREMESLRDGLAEGLASQLGVKNDFVKSMLAIFLDQNLFRPMAEALGGERGLFSIGMKALGVPGFATGGSMRLGGRGGVDQNLLSLNGQPLARVSRGEVMNISPNQRLGSRAAPAPVINNVVQVDARGAVMNDQFARGILSQAAKMDADAQRQTLKAAPGVMQARQRYGR